MKPRFSLSVVVIAACSAIHMVWANPAPSTDAAYPLCSVYLTDPGHVNHVPVNADWDVYYRSGKPNVCQGLIHFVDAATGKEMAVTVSYATEWPDHLKSKTAEPVFFGFARFHPHGTLPPSSKVTIMMGATPITYFVTEEAGKAQEGDFLGEDPVDLAVPLCPHASHLSRSQIPECTFHYWEWYYRLTAGLTDHRVSPELGAQQTALIKKRQILSREYSVKTLTQSLSHLFDTRPALTDVTLTRVRYMSKDPMGQSLPLSGLLVTPVHPVSLSVIHLPLVMLLHGYVSPESAPSEGNMSDDVLAVQLAAQGFYVFVPDYIGHGISQKSVEPFLLSTSAHDMLRDALRALHHIFPKWDGHVAIEGASQGAYNGMSLYRLAQQTQERKYVFDDLFLAEGPYNTYESVSQIFRWQVLPLSHSQSPYVRRTSHQIQTWLRYFYAYLSTNEHYGYLPSSTLSHIYATPSTLNIPFIQDFLSGEVGLPERLSAILHYSSLIHSGDHYDSPKLIIRIYGYDEDALVASQNTKDLLFELHRSGHVFGDLREGSCRVGSELEKMSKRFVQLNSMMLHSYCALVAYDDFLAVMGMHHVIRLH